MDFIFAGYIVVLFSLAIFNLWIGVSNDAVNFLNSAIGAKAAKFRTIIIIAGLGIFLGATMSTGMIDIARHGIFNPEMFSFQNVMYIYLAVMITNILVIDLFNTLGMPTSTTVSMVFELLGAAFAFAILGISGNDDGMTLANYLNSGKALSVIMAIFVSVAIAFFFGIIIQYISRLIFTFRFREKLKWKIGIFGGIATTAILYFLLISGLKDLAFMTPQAKAWIAENTGTVLLICFAGFSVIMQILYFLKVDVLKVVVLIGTFALATAFAGNDLVNFLGAPLSGYSAYTDFMSSGSSNPDTYMMDSLNEPAGMETIFLVAAGIIMVFALAFSKKAHKVTQTQLNLSKQEAGDEMFGSSKVARGLVRCGNAIGIFLQRLLPDKTKKWIDKRFDSTQIEMEDGAAYDLIRASVNLIVASILIAAGTSMQLPLSTTYVTFMVAMGTSLSDKAWGRESAVFRITGVLSVIGGWFITAGLAFTLCFVIAILMYYGGNIMAAVLVCASIALLVRNNIGSPKKTKKEKETDKLFNEMVEKKGSPEIWPLLSQHVMLNEYDFLTSNSAAYRNITDALLCGNLKLARKASSFMNKEKYVIKNVRRKETVCLRLADNNTAMEKSSWFHMLHNSMEQLYYCIRRICEPVTEHMENNFPPLPKEFASEFSEKRNAVMKLLYEVTISLKDKKCSDYEDLKIQCNALQKTFSDTRKSLVLKMQQHNINLTVAYLYLNLLQESEQLVVLLQQLVRGSQKFYE